MGAPASPGLDLSKSPRSSSTTPGPWANSAFPQAAAVALLTSPAATKASIRLMKPSSSDVALALAAWAPASASAHSSCQAPRQNNCSRWDTTESRLTASPSSEGGGVANKSRSIKVSNLNSRDASSERGGKASKAKTTADLASPQAQRRGSGTAWTVGIQTCMAPS